MAKLSKKEQTNWVDSKMFIDLIADIRESDGATIGMDVCDVLYALKAGTKLMYIDGDKVNLLKAISKDVKALLLFSRGNKETPLKDIVALTENIKSYVPPDTDIKISFISDETITNIGESRSRIWVVCAGEEL